MGFRSDTLAKASGIVTKPWNSRGVGHGCRRAKHIGSHSFVLKEHADPNGPSEPDATLQLDST